ncbi:metal ABC transporter permease [Polynucleobacter sp. es-MAR-4]|uniref:metal ABC transporter permease n=1 Tax=Polynucleobacter sp. es-MAR-4 TaxID=1855655 RepID=UPI001C0D22EA|nr:metal ABC transporter permease [Polynucleobacter sp. es-MAR-4]MBU3636076.1 metal ABC transporter permease [Polynucleobacter sp. es-MAR-4]
MTELTELLAVPFFVCVVLIGVHCQFGLHVLKKNVVFVDLALAQCASLGATVAFMQGHLPQSVGAYSWSLGFALSAALMLSLVRFAPAKIPAEALVGVLYIVSAAAAILLIERAPQGAEHLKQILTGSVLTVDISDLYGVVALYMVIGTILALATTKQWMQVGGTKGWIADLCFYSAFGLVVTSSVAIAGVLLVFSFLIIPALIGLLLAQKAITQWIYGVVLGCIAALLGLLASYWLDASTGATIVCAFGLLLALFLLGYLFRKSSVSTGKLLKMTLIGMLLAIAISLAWLAANPRADQPLFDSAERYVPVLRSAYFTKDEEVMYQDAKKYVARYTAELNRLGEMEVRNRYENTETDDFLVQKISSFQQSYNEMIKGETFVMREVRSRARERLRWPAIIFSLVLGLSCGALIQKGLRPRK